jgi:hypothetical protein
MMKKYLSIRTVPAALLLVCVLSFGLLIPWLGFYFDDWPVITLARLQPVSAFWKFYSFDRPLSAWTFILTIPLLGTRPIVWHIFTLIIRWLAVVLMWWTLKGIWPRQSRAVTWMAFLFAIYPVFDQQPIAVAYNQHWIVYALFFLSMGLMVQANRRPKWFFPLTGLSLLTAAIHMASMEYFIGLELLRPYVLWILLQEKIPNNRQRLSAALKQWLPYLFILFAYVVYRLFFLKLGGADPNNPELLYNLASQPISASVHLVQIAFQDFINLIASAWYRTVDPVNFDLTDRSVLFSLAISLVSGLLTLLYLLRLPDEANGQSERPSNWVREAALLGILAILLGPLPVWLTDRQATTSTIYGGRFALASMFGASMLLIALLEWFSPRRARQAIVLGLLVGVAVGFHLRNATVYYKAWLSQTQFYWQLHWRAPQIEPSTAILSDNELFPYMGRASTALVLNLLYPPQADPPALPYWFFELYHDIGTPQAAKLERGKELTGEFRSFNFTGYSLNSLAIFYKPGAGRCLWVLSPDDVDNPDLSDITRSVLPATNLSRILENPEADGYPPTTIFGAEPEHTWCYYFERADLARQYGQWEQVVQLGKQAKQKGYSPEDPQEWIPFIEAYAHTGQWDTALKKTEEISTNNQELTPRLCNLWHRIQNNVTHPGDQANLEQLFTQLNCSEQP